jgi:3-hydroxyacyl-CoA dehydrogenase
MRRLPAPSAIPVVVGVCDGFVGNRMLGRRHRETERLLMTGALPEQVDRVLTGFGFPMGPCAMADLAGIDVGWRVRQARGTPMAIADGLYEAGRYGQKNGRVHRAPLRALVVRHANSATSPPPVSIGFRNARRSIAS